MTKSKQHPSPPVSDAGANGPTRRYWRSLEQRRLPHDAEADAWREFPPGAEHAPVELRSPGVSRRKFFGIMGASAALAGATGCVRKPVEHILPYAKRPEEIIPGKPIYYATAYQLGATVEGLTVESQDGRPTKVEGNPKHSGSQGATSPWSQASVLDLYDPARTRVPHRRGAEGLEPTDWDTVREEVGKLLDEAQASGGKGLALVIRHPASPTQRGQLKAFRERFPNARVFLDDLVAPVNAQAAAEMIGGQGARARYHLDDTKVVFAADSDFLLTEQDTVRLSREWARTRRMVGPTDPISRLYVVEPHFTVTGGMADHRRRVRAGQVGDVLVALAHELASGNHGAVKLPRGASLDGLPSVQLDPDLQKFVQVLARDLTSKEHQHKSAIVVGSRQPPWVHALGYLLNAMLGNQGVSLRWMIDTQAVATESLDDLAKALAAGEIDTVLCLETNPVYDAAGSLGLAEAMGRAKAVVHMGLLADETAAIATWHLPVSHYLEAWGDLEATDGTVTICQPLIAPLHGTYSPVELLGFLGSGRMIDGYSLVKGHWQQTLGVQFSEKRWRQWLHDGIVTGIPRDPGMPALDGWGRLGEAIADGRSSTEGWEINIHLDPCLLDGRFANNAWMQELPHAMSKLTWDNAAYVSPTSAAELGVGNEAMVKITVEGQTLEIPVFIAPGQADKTVSLTLGRGRKIARGEVAEGAGFDVSVVRPAGAAWFASGQVAASGGTYTLASTQDYGSMKPPSVAGFDFPERAIAVEMTRQEFKDQPNYVEQFYMMEPSRLQHLWDPPKLTGKQQWGMSVDLNACTGCNACVVACQAENNIPTVGKKQILRGREMHWMRIDRYYRGDDENEPTAIVQPMFCQHCEAAPCETVCPVGATAHSPEGLNDMAYNRCIGTRYCSNNCPYKVRRYNFFNYNTNLRTGEFWTDEPSDAWLRQMQKNPDVTVRFRGVMEKCTYCVQRINQAKIDAHVDGEDLVEDGAIVTACQQVCPTGAIVFGDIRDPDSAVSKAKRSPRDYEVLRDLNTHPRTTYLARVRNPHPDLV